MENLQGRRAPRKHSDSLFRTAIHFPTAQERAQGKGAGRSSKKLRGVLQRKLKKGLAIHSKSRLPYEEHLGLDDEEVASKKKVEYDKGSDVAEARNHPWAELPSIGYAKT